MAKGRGPGDKKDGKSSEEIIRERRNKRSMNPPAPPGMTSKPLSQDDHAADEKIIEDQFGPEQEPFGSSVTVDDKNVLAGEFQAPSTGQREEDEMKQKEQEADTEKQKQQRELEDQKNEKQIETQQQESLQEESEFDDFLGDEEFDDHDRDFIENYQSYADEIDPLNKELDPPPHDLGRGSPGSDDPGLDR